MSAKVRDYYAAEAELLLKAGTSPLAIAARFGIQPGSVGRALTREGRADLARPFFREQHRQHLDPGGVCECGTPTSRKGRRCHPCAIRARDDRARTH